MKMRYLFISFLSLVIFSCNLDSYVAPGQPVAPQSEVRAIPVPESGRPVPGADYYFNSYSYIRVYDSGNQADILTFGPDKDEIGEFLRYTLVNTPDPGAAADGSEASLTVDTYWGSYEIIGSDIDIYSLYDYSYDYSPSDNPFIESLGVTVRNNTAPFKGKSSFDLSSDGLILTFDGASYIRMDQYVEDAMVAALAAGIWNIDTLDFCRVLYLNVLLTQSVIPGAGGLFRYVNLVTNLISTIINDSGEEEIVTALYGSLYGDGLFRDIWIPPVEMNPLPSNTKLLMSDSHQVLSHMIVEDAGSDQILGNLANDGTGKLWGSFDISFTETDGTETSLILYLGDNALARGSSLTIGESVVRAHQESAVNSNYPLAVYKDGVALVAAGLAVDSDYYFLNPGNFTLPTTE
jgi:hypothetical protein